MMLIISTYYLHYLHIIKLTIKTLIIEKHFF